MQYSISQRQQCLRHLDRICRRHQTYQWLYPPVGVSTPSTSRKQKTACTPASRLYTATGVLLPLWSDYWERLMKRVVLQQGAERLFVADHDRYWNRCQQTERYVASQTVVGHKTGSSDRNADGMKTADNDAGLVILPDGRKYYIAAFVMDSYETDEDNANIIARISRMVYDAMRWEARGLVGSSSYKFWYSGISCRKI